ncbi:MAG TPA: PQQ-binding-like beta-propeller repeat protein [Planctomycetota bacterium]|nr:PQQ-binding-like beta-propeller repeat protein [Planctomycetota bacterium]HRR82974.1 PQQ-binding-like beta-propeller repeat protein [Planctomycetota bacterium]HRT96789.1 PQQ-binding-like beta-propeller repeat protein [Planctomycetota bacterium]
MHRAALASLFLAGLLSLPAQAVADWPQFRGPLGNGHAAAPGDGKPLGLPLRWSETENIAWKTAIPHRGWSSPVVLGGQVWLTTATTDGHDFFAVCVDAETGKFLFNERLFHSDKPEPLGNNVNCYGSPTPVIEPGRAYIHFGSYGTACLDTAAFKVLWERTDLPCRHYRGPGASPILFEDLLILSFDGVDVQYLAALDKKTGRTVWKTDRTTEWDDLDADGKPKIEGDFRKSFTTPLVFEAGGVVQMISPGSKACYSYDPRTGKELWHVRHTAHTSVLRPLFSHGLAIFCTGLGGPQLWAVRPDGRGDVSATHVAWKATQGAPRTPSPIIVGDLLYMVEDSGLLTCLEVATGKEVWKERLGGNYAASPIYADGRLYLCSQQGKTTVLKPGRIFEVLATNTLESGFMASPAVAGRALFLRTRTHLYRIEAPASPGK